MSRFAFSKLVSTRQGKRVDGLLELNGKTYRAVSGGYGNGELPNGSYRVDPKRFATGLKEAAYRAGGVSFWLPIEPMFDTHRNGIGIHPDGNVPGTEGCIGIMPSDCRRFYEDWLSLNDKLKPRQLEVGDATAVRAVG